MRPDLKLDLTTDWTIAKSYAQGEIWYDAIATLADRLPSVRLTGASYRGIGIPAVIGEARSVAASIDDPAGAQR